MPKDNQNNDLRPPEQARSQKTLERIFVATEKLLESQRFEDITVSAITKRAKSSVGAFYARFADKDALLNALDQRYTDESLAQLDTIIERLADPALSLHEVSREIVTGIWNFHARKPGLIRSLVLRARTHPDARYQARGDEITKNLFSAVIRALARFECNERKISFALLNVISMVRELTLFPDGPANAIAMKREESIEELSNLFTGYLMNNRGEDI